MLPKYKDIVDLLKKGSTIEAQEQIMSLREGALELQEENQELKKKIQELETQMRSIDDWAEEKERYALVSPWQGPAQVYALKQNMAKREEPHFLCSNCFQNSKKKVILNPGKRGMWVTMDCPVCKASMETGYKGIGSSSYAEEYINES